MRSRTWLLLWSFCVGSSVSLSVSPAQGQSLPVQNGDFESPVLSQGGFSMNAVPNWSPVATGAGFGVFHPTIASWGYVAPSGNQLLYLNGATVEQVFVDGPVAGVTYLLSLDVVHRPSFFNQSYSVQLRAGTTVLAQDAGTLTPPIGQASRIKLFATLSPLHPALGQPFSIRLSGGTQTNFDAVRLVPEPLSSTGILGGAILAATLARRGRSGSA